MSQVIHDRAILLGNGFEIEFYKNMSLEQIIKLINKAKISKIKRKIQKINFSWNESFIKQNINYVSHVVLEALKIQASRSDLNCSIEENILRVNKIIRYNYDISIENICIYDLLVQKLFLTYVEKEFNGKTKKRLKKFNKKHKIFKSYIENIPVKLTTNYNDYDDIFLVTKNNNKFKNIHGRIGDCENQPQFLSTFGTAKKEPNFQNYSIIDVFGLSFNDDEILLKAIFFGFTKNNKNKYSFLNYYYFNENDLIDFKKLIFSFFNLKEEKEVNSDYLDYEKWQNEGIHDTLSWKRWDKIIKQKFVTYSFESRDNQIIINYNYIPDHSKFLDDYKLIINFEESKNFWQK